MPKRTRASRAPVISLAAVRKARSTPPVEAECCPYAVMEAMIDGYFRALSIQLEKLKAERRKA